MVNQSLYSTTFLAFGGRGLFCTRCLMADHSQEDCALHPGRDVPVVRLREVAPGPSHRDDPEQRKRRGRRGACFAFNDGRCTAPHCRFEHVCSTCGGDHKRLSCRGQMRDPQRPKERETLNGTRALGRSTGSQFCLLSTVSE